MESVESLLHYSCRSGLPFTVMGDVNIDMLSLNASSRQLTELMNTFGCVNAITNATRLSGETATLLDICIINSWSPSLVAGAISLEISDHLPIFCAFPSSRDHYLAIKKEQVLFRKTNAHTLHLFRQRIIEENWEDLFEQVDSNAAYDIFIGKIKKCYGMAFQKVLKDIGTKKSGNHGSQMLYITK